MNITYGAQSLRQFQEWKLNQHVSDESAETAKTKRSILMDSLEISGLQFRAGGTKVFKGIMSRGCETCVNGLISFLYINGLCTRDCFFCPQNRTMAHERPTSSAGMVFHDPDHYVDYIEAFGFKGVGFSGGEPLLVMEKLLLFLNRIKKKFGDSVYTWFYTNGDLVDERKLKDLRDAGMDEIRFNLSARDYDWGPVRLARRFFDTVTVEIPAIPEDFERVIQILPPLGDIGVKHFNVHQLNLSQYNFKKISGRDYSMFHTRDSGLVIHDSEMTALRLLKQSADQDFDFSLNYCSTIYKERYQSSGMRKRLARPVVADHETISDSGYIVRISAKGSQENLGKIVALFQEKGVRDALWKLLETENGDFCLLFHPELIDSLPQDNSNLFFHCFEAMIIPRERMDEGFDQSFEEKRITPSGSWTIGLKQVAGADFVNAGMVRTLLKEPQSVSQDRQSEEHRDLHHLKSYIRIEHGFSDLISAKTYWAERKAASMSGLSHERTFRTVTV